MILNSCGAALCCSLILIQSFQQWNIQIQKKEKVFWWVIIA